MKLSSITRSMMVILGSWGGLVLAAAFAGPDSQPSTKDENPPATTPEKPMAPEQKFDVTMTRQFDAPVEAVWKAWTDGSEVMRWWGPTGFTSPVAKMDVREGGVSLVCMRAPKEWGGADMYNTWTYTKIEPLKRIEYIFRFSDKDGKIVDPATMGVPPGVPNEVPHVLTFKALGPNKTEITLTESGYTTEEAVAISKMGLGQCFDKLAASLAKTGS